MKFKRRRLRISEIEDSSSWELTCALRISTLAALTTGLVIDPTIDNGLQLSSQIGALEGDFLDQCRCITVCFFVGAIPSHRIWAALWSRTFDHNAHCVCESNRRVRCVCCLKRRRENQVSAIVRTRCCCKGASRLDLPGSMNISPSLMLMSWNLPSSSITLRSISPLY